MWPITTITLTGILVAIQFDEFRKHFWKIWQVSPS